MFKKPRTRLVQDLFEDVICEKHLEPLQLFCDDDQLTLCKKCSMSQEHKHHVVYKIEEAEEYYKKSFEEKLNKVEEKIKAVKNIMTNEQERMVSIQEEDHKYKEMITYENKMLLQLIFETYQMNSPNQPSSQTLSDSCTYYLAQFKEDLEKFLEILQKLDNWTQENIIKLKNNEVTLSQQLHSLQKIRAELQKKCGESTVGMLQNARYVLERGESLVHQSVEPACITEHNLIHITGLSNMLNKFQRQITLDGKTAHHSLVLSEDLKSMKLKNDQQNIPGNSRRLDFSSTVLGVEKFTSGKHYWEVDVEKATKWQLGLFEQSPDSKGDTHKASGKKFLLTKSMMEKNCIFWVSPPLKKVSMRQQMSKIGIFLHYECGYLSFYDVTQRCFIYAFSDLIFQGPVRPFFSLCIPDEETVSDSLSICFSQDSPCNVTVNSPSS